MNQLFCNQWFIFVINFNCLLTELTSGTENPTNFSVKTKIAEWLSGKFNDLTSDKAKTTDFWVKIWTTDRFSKIFNDSILDSW